MSIENLSISGKDSASMTLTWTWPVGVKCVRVIFVHKLGGRALEELSRSELDSVSDLCFVDEFRRSNNEYKYLFKGNETGRISFAIYVCSVDGQVLDINNHSNIVSDAAKPNVISFLINSQKVKSYKVVYLNINSQVDIPANVVEYIVYNVHYPINQNVVKGSNRFGPIILPAKASIGLGISAEHENEYVIRHG